MLFLKNIIDKIKVIIPVFFIFFVLTKTCFAVELIENRLGTTDVPELVGIVLRAILGLTGSVALIIFIYGGLLMMFSGGDSGKVKKGTDAMVYAVIGLAVIFASYAILDFVISTLQTATTGTPAATESPGVQQPAQAPAQSPAPTPQCTQNSDCSGTSPACVNGVCVDLGL